MRVEEALSEARFVDRIRAAAFDEGVPKSPGHQMAAIDLAHRVGVSAETKVAVELVVWRPKWLGPWCCGSAKQSQLRWARTQLR
jgi:hypothetical protein